MKRFVPFTCFIILFASFFIVPSLSASTRGVSVVAEETSGARSRIHLYDRMIAVIIGIDIYKDLPPKDHLSYAVKDAKGVENALQKSYRFDNIITLYNQHATKNEIMSVLQGKLAETGPDDAVFVYFAGHGITRPIQTGTGELGYLIPYDGSLDRNRMHLNISMEQIKSDVCWLIPAKHVFFVMDACFGGLLLDRRAVDVTPGRDAAYLREITGEKVRQVLTAGQANEPVLDGGPGGHSVFTGRLIETLDGVQDYITARELMVGVSKKVYGDAAHRGHKQRPRGGEIYGTGDFVFVSNYEQRLQDSLVAAKYGLKDARERSDELARSYAKLLEDEKSLTKKAESFTSAAQKRSEDRELAAVQAKRKENELERARVEEELRQKAEMQARLERQIQERANIQGTIKDLEQGIDESYRELEEKKRTELAMIERDKQAELSRVKELMEQIRQKREALDATKLKSLTIADAIKECKDISRQMEETRNSFDGRLTGALNDLRARYDKQRERYASEIERLDNILTEYRTKIEKITKEYYADRPEKDMFETQKQFQERLDRFTADADQKAGAARKEFEDSLTSVNAKRAEYIKAKTGLETPHEMMRKDLEHKMHTEKQGQLEIYIKQLADIKNQSFVRPTTEIEMFTYKPEEQIFPMLAFFKANNKRRGAMLRLKIAGDEARALWKNKQFIRGEAVLRLNTGLDDVTVGSIDIIDDVCDRRYPSQVYASFIGNNGRFIALGNGTVMDKKPGLMWAARDNGEDIDWQGAKRYCENFRGGGYTDWRMPTTDELAGIYDETSDKRYKSPEFIELTAYYIWASEIEGSKGAYLNFGGVCKGAHFNFSGGRPYWYGQLDPGNLRALPVRLCNW